MSQKGQITVLEMITVTIVLFVSFTVFFQTTGIESKWDNAQIILRGRDTALTADRSGLMYDFVSDPVKFSDFIHNVVPERNLVFWSTLEGTPHSEITVACECTPDQIRKLNNWIGRVKLNGRDIAIDVIQNSGGSIQQSDALIIWGATTIQDDFKSEVVKYLKSGNGVIGISDVANPNANYVEIFGVDRCQDVLGSGCSTSGGTELTFTPQDTAYLKTYQAYKFFTHIPIKSAVSVTEAGFDIQPDVVTIPTEGGISSCGNPSPVYDITLDFRSTQNTYWVCNEDTIYVDTNHNNIADKIVNEGGSFTIDGFDFKVNYIDLNRTFVTIQPGFAFVDDTTNNVRLYPMDRDASKVLLKDGDYSLGRPVPVVVANTSTAGRAFWTQDMFSSSSVGHDKKLLIQSLVLAAANKNSKDPTVGTIELGVLTPYINIQKSNDMLEIYQLNLGLGFPF